MVLSLVKKKGSGFSNFPQGPTLPTSPAAAGRGPRRRRGPGETGRTPGKRVGIPNGRPGWGGGDPVPCPAPRRWQRGEPAGGGEPPRAETGAGPGAGLPGRAGLLRSTARRRAVRQPAAVVLTPSTSLQSSRRGPARPPHAVRPASGVRRPTLSARPRGSPRPAWRPRALAPWSSARSVAPRQVLAFRAPGRRGDAAVAAAQEGEERSRRG